MDRLRKVCQPVDFQTYAEDPLIRDVPERNLQVAVEAMLDIGNHLISAYGWECPEEYQNVPKKLAKQGVLPEDFAQRLRKMAAFRNILVHEYLEIDDQLVYNILQTGLEDFELFARYIRDFIGED